MKKRGFLVVGILMVVTIVILQRRQMLLQMKKIAWWIADLIENGALTVYNNIKTFVIVDI